MVRVKSVYRKGGEALKKDTYIRVRCSSAQKKLIKNASKRLELSMSELMLTATQKHITKEDINSVHGYESM